MENFAQSNNDNSVIINVLFPHLTNQVTSITVTI